VQNRDCPESDRPREVQELAELGLSQEFVRTSRINLHCECVACLAQVELDRAFGGLTVDGKL